jgi:reactive chlorine resistance protein C
MSDASGHADANFAIAMRQRIDERMNLMSAHASIGAVLDATSPAVRLERAGAGAVRWSLIFLLVLFGGMKWAAFEADAIHPLITNSPFLSWTDALFGKQGASIFVGVIELATAALLGARRWSPTAAMIGGFAGIGMFLTTLSFLVTTPSPNPEAPFILKDICLLASSIWLAGEAWVARTRTQS